MPGLAPPVPISAADLAMALSASAPRPRLIYVSNGTATVGGGGANGAVRSSMLPPGQTGSSLLIKANAMPVGSCLALNGAGLISAASVSPGNFNFLPHITPAGGSRTDLSGLIAGPLIGVAGITDLWMLVSQTPTGLQTSGIVRYGVSNGQAYSLLINAAGAIVASDPTVDRTFGVDGQWQNSNTANYITSQLVSIQHWPAPTN